MGLKIVNQSAKYRPPRLAKPPASGYLHLAAAVEPPRGRIPRPGTRQGLLLFNYFVGADSEVSYELWDHLAGWFTAETGLDNSVLLEPLSGESDYLFVNHARWDLTPAALAVRQFTKPSFYRYVLANLRANRTGAMPLLYHLA